MKIRPISFTAEMLLAIRDGRKTQTRRVIKNKHWPIPIDKGYEWTFHPTVDGQWEIGAINKGTGDGQLFGYINCPHGQAGDGLWLKEPWRIVGWNEGDPLLLEYKDGEQLSEPRSSDYYDEDKYAQFHIDCSDECDKAGVPLDTDRNLYLIGQHGSIPTRWRSPRFMPKFASRDTLKILSVGVERIQDISFEDCIAEGCDHMYFDKGPHQCCRNTHIGERWQFHDLWNSINLKRGYGWDVNPWVWVIEFDLMDRKDVKSDW